MEITAIGLDIAKRVFQAHGADVTGKAVLRRKLQRAEVLTFFASLPPCLVGIEACSTAHHWAREISALGHEVRLMPASYVKPYVKRGKTDAADAEAICEAMTRPTMPRDNQGENRIASPDLFPGIWRLPHLKCSRLASATGVRNEAGKHGDEGRTGCCSG
jgi:transposase